MFYLPGIRLLVLIGGTGKSTFPDLCSRLMELEASITTSLKVFLGCKYPKIRKE